MRYDADVLRQFIAALEFPTKELTPWERQFVESVSDQLERRGALTDNQIDKLETIYAEKTP